MNMTKNWFLLMGMIAANAWAAGSNDAPQPVASGVYRGMLQVAHFDVSPPLRDIKPIPVPSGPLRPSAEREDDPDSGLEWLYTIAGQGPDLIAQAQVGQRGSGTFTTPLLSFNAQNNISGVNPPDPAGEVGPNHFVAMSNLSLQIFDKTGTSVFGPVFTNTLWSGFGGACQTENSGDPVVLYDQFADRWIITQFTAAGPTFFNCVAISQTADPTAAYYRYAFTTGTNFPDYPKYGVWSNAYIISTREFAGNTFAGIGAYAVNRAQMVAGNPAPQVISFVVPPGAAAFNTGDGLLPADIDGFELPPPGAPSYFVGSMDAGGPYGAPQDALTLWKFVIDFTTPANSSFTLANTIPIAAYDTVFPCTPSARECIPQPGTATKIDILSYRQRPLNRLAYRNFGTHESLVTNQSVEAAAGMAGIRWWEIRSPNSAPSLFQEGTYAPGITDGIHRWMGSVAMDSAGNMALGYSASSGTVFPSIRYTGRLSSDTLGTMPQGEGELIAGTGSNTGGGNRWGDYTSLTLDPVDDCTFWYVNEWVPTTSASGWQLRVGSFRFNECGTPTFTMGAAPTAQAICANVDADYTVNLGSIASFNSPVTLMASGHPAGTTATFSENPVATLPGSSVLTIGNTGAAAAGTYNILIEGAAAGPINRSKSVDLTVQTAPPAASTLTIPADNATAVPANVTFTWDAVPNTIDYTLQVATDAAFTNIVRTTTTTATTWTVSPTLDTSSTYFWRVFARNACSFAAELFADGFEGTGPAVSLGTVSATSTFVTAAAPGDCPAGPAPTIVASEDFEGAATGWVQEAGGTGTNTWAINTAFPFAGTKALQGLTPATASDQRFISPAFNLPSVGNGLTLSFQSRQQMESRSGGCWDGGFIEVSVGGGAYTQITAGLLTDPYEGPLGSGNPVAPAAAWCGDPQAYLKSVIDLAPYAGQSNVRFRFRVTSDGSVNRAEGWNIDNVEIKRCN
jgi:hypothetical protein